MSLDLLSVALEEVRRRAEFKTATRYVERSSEPQRGFHTSQEFGRIIKGANRSGKTTSGTMESLYWVGLESRMENGVRLSPFSYVLPKLPVRGRIVTPELPGTMDDNHVQRDKFKEMCPSRLLRGGSWTKAYSVIGHTLWFQNGSWIEFKSSEQALDKHAGESLHFVWFDEEMPKPIYYENLLRLDRDVGGWWFTYTPAIGYQWIFDEIYTPGKQGRPGYRLFEVDIEHNRRNLREGFIEQMMDTLSPREQAIRLRGNYAENSGLVFDIFGAEHMMDLEVVV